MSKGETPLKRQSKKSKTQSEDIMAAVKITYFKSLNVNNPGRVLDMIGRDIPHLVANAAQNMAADESFACFTAPNGHVIALDRQSQFVVV